MVYGINRLMKPKFLKGFTLLELLIVITITVVISSISIANFRQGERRRRIAIASDSIISALRSAQNLTLTGKEIPQSTCGSKTAKYYEVRFTYSTAFTIYAEDNCSNLYAIESYSLPLKTQIKANGLLLNGTPAGTSLYVKFSAPFAKITGALNGAGGGSLTTANITIESTEEAIERSVTIDGVSGRIGE